MICGKCGTENVEGASICLECGSPLEAEAVSKPEEKVEEAKVIKEAAPSNNPGTMDASAAVKAQLAAQQKKLKGIIGGLLAVVAIGLVIVLMLTGKPTIKLDKYLSVETDGYDGYGNAWCNIDWGKLEADYGQKLSLTKAAKKEMGVAADYISPVAMIQEGISVTLDKNGELANGEEINYTWNVEEEYLSRYVACKLNYKDGSHVVEGLEEVGSFDPFAGVEVSFSGIAPNGMAELTSGGSTLSSGDFIYEPSYGLKNGDKVKVSLYTSDPEYYIRRFGKVPSTTEKEFEVSGLSELVSDISTLPDEFLDGMKKEAEDIIYAYTASNYDKEVSIGTLNYKGYAFGNPKQSGDDNWMALIFDTDINHSGGEFRKTKIYYPIVFNKIVNDDGGMSYEEIDGIYGHSYIEDTYYNTAGYINPLTSYIELVGASRDRYDVVCGDGYEAYGEYEDIKALADMSDEFKTAIIEEGKELVESTLAKMQEDDDDLKASEASLAGEYLLISKNLGTDFASNNRYIIVYSAQITSTKPDDENYYFEPKTVYYPVVYDGIVKLPGDEYMITVTSGIYGDVTWRDDKNSGWSIYRSKGYLDGAEMFSQLVTQSRDKYTYEVSEGLKQFGE